MQTLPAHKLNSSGIGRKHVAGSAAQGPQFQRRWHTRRAQPTSRAAAVMARPSEAEESSVAATLSNCSVIKPWYMSFDEEAEDVVGIAVTNFANISVPYTQQQHAAVGYRMPLKVRRERPEGHLGDMECMQAWIAPTPVSSDTQRYERIRRFVEQNAVRPIAGSIDTWSKSHKPAPGWIMSFDEEAMGSYEESVLGSV